MTAKQKLRILVVDDEPAVADSVARLLAYEGHVAEVAHGPREALNAFEPGKFDLVITDYAMPGMQGDALAAAIRGRAPAQRIVILTARREVFGEVGCPAAADLIVSKPFDAREFLAAIARLFGIES